MSEHLNRRQLLSRSAATAAAAALAWPTGLHAKSPSAGQPASLLAGKGRMKLGLVTYNVACDWDLPTLIERCREIGINAVEFRSTHKHGVEPTLSKAQRKDVKKQCADGGLVIWGLGSACEYHSPDAAELQKNIDETKRFIELAKDVGARQIKVRPNRLPKEVSEQKTIEQIGKSLQIVGESAADAGVEICCEVHGSDTAHPPVMRKIMDTANHPSVGVTWNSNTQDIKDGSVKEYFELLQPWIYNVHINELVSGYPYRELFALLNAAGYDRYTMIEAQPLKSANPEDTIRFMKFYKALWQELSRPT